MDPVRRCPGCHLKTQTPIQLDDGRHYCEECGAKAGGRAPVRLDGSVDPPNLVILRPERTESIESVEQSEDEPSEETEGAHVTMAAEYETPQPAPLPAQPPAARARAAANPAARQPLAGDQALPLALMRERDRVEKRRRDLEQLIRDATAEIELLGDREAHIDALLGGERPSGNYVAA